MYPSRRSTSSTLERSFDAGLRTLSRRAFWPFRMRVSMSPRGSLNDMISIPPLPARLDHPRDLPGGGEFAQRDTRQFEFAVRAARPSGQLAPVALAHGCGVPRNLGQPQPGEGTLLERALLVIRDRLQALATAGPLLRQLRAILIAFDSADRQSTRLNSSH